jgi:RNA polymerase sigma-70 factor (ECF subfamily)
MASEPTGTTPQTLLAHAGWVRRLAAALVRADDADDVAQQAFAQALVAPPPSRNLRGWFAAIVRNVARRSRRDEATRVRYEAFAPAAIESGDPALALARAELHRRVVDAVLALAEPYRSTLVLRFFDEKTAEEIALAQALPLETVRTRVKRGLAQLRVRLGDEARHDGGTLREALALLLVPGSGSSSASGAGTGVAAMSAMTKGVLVAAGVVAVAAVGWRWMADPVAPAQHVAVAPARSPSASSASEPVAEPVAEPARTTDPPAAAPSRALAGDPAEFTLTGRVVDPRGEPVAGANVFLIGDQDPLVVSNREFLVERSAALLEASAAALHPWEGRTWSERDGSFRFDAVDPFRALTVEAIEETLGIGAVAAPQHATSEGVTVALEPMIVVRGRVSDVRGDVVANAYAFCEFGIDERHSTKTTSLTMKPDGTFCFTTTLVPGLIFAAECDDGRSARTPPLLFDPGAPLQRRVDLVLRDTNDACHGRVVDRNGDAIDLVAQLMPRLTEGERRQSSESAVQLFSCGCEKPPPETFRMVDVTRVGSVDVNSARYHVAMDERTRWIALVVRDRTLGAVAATLADAGVNGPDLRVDLARLPEEPSRASLRVRLLDAESGAALVVPDAEYQVQMSIVNEFGSEVGIGHRFKPSRHDDSAGTAWFDAVQRGRVSVRVRVAGRVGVSRTIAVAPRAEPYELDFAMRRVDTSLRGTVVDEAGSPIAGAGVTLFGHDDESPMSTRSNESGRFRFAQVACGAADLLVECGPFAPSVQRIDVGRDGERTVIALAHSGQVEIGVPEKTRIVALRVVREQEHELPLEVAVFDPDPRPEYSRGLPEPKRRPLIKRVSPTRCSCALAPGRARVELELGDGRKLRRDVEVVAGATVAVDFE